MSLRQLVLFVVRKFEFDIRLGHHWVAGCKFKLNTFLHKGYWFHGKNREKSTMLLFSQIVEPRQKVVEVGAHIGYISLYFSSLVGKKGVVQVFEPGLNNLPYLRENIEGAKSLGLGTVLLTEAAVGHEDGSAEFYEENLTGQNNSLVKDFDGLRRNAKMAYSEPDVVARTVKIVTLDSFLGESSVDFIKIDIEGGEWPALQGAVHIISRDKPALMVEVQANEKEIFVFLSDSGYRLFNDVMQELVEPSELKGNVFCLHTLKHNALIKELQSNMNISNG